MSSHIARKVVASFQKITNPSQEYQKLSLREQEVIDLLAQGYTYQKIADTLKISYATVHTHTSATSMKNSTSAPARKP